MPTLEDIKEAILHPTALAGIGGLLGAWKLLPGANLFERALHLGAGTVTAIVMTPWVMEVSGLTSKNAERGITFLIGIFGLVGMFVVWEKLKSIPFVDHIWERVLSWIPRKG